jgi:peroxiredoxin
MPSTTGIPAAHGVRPTQPAPDLTVPLLRGGTYRLADQRPGTFTMVVFFRGLHCPVCRAQLVELERRVGECEERGIEVIAVSGETRERTTWLAQEWRLEHLALAYGLTEEGMRAWGLFVSHGINDSESPVFNEPGLFLLSPDHTVYYESILSMPVGLPPCGRPARRHRLLGRPRLPRPRRPLDARHGHSRADKPEVPSINGRHRLRGTK